MSNGGQRMGKPVPRDILDWMSKHWQIPVGFFMMIAIMFCALVFGMVQGCEIMSKNAIEQQKIRAQQSKDFFQQTR